MSKKIDLTTLEDNINKRFGKGTFFKPKDSPIDGIDKLSTGSIKIDKALGGGMPFGRIVEIYGPSASGKTSLTLQIMAQAQKLGHTVAFIDAEHALDLEYAAKLGVDADNVYISQPDCGEDALEIVDAIVKDGQIKVVVVDSVAALVPRAELEGEMGQSNMGTHARLMSQACRKITGSIGKANCLVIMINQVRSKIGVVYGNPEVTTGGNALKFYSSQRLEVRRKADASLKDKNGELIGHIFKVKVAKNKIAPPFRTAECTLIYGEGVSRKEEIVDYAVDMGILTKTGAWYGYEDAKIAQGKANLRQFLEDNPEVLTELEVKVKEKLNEDA